MAARYGNMHQSTGMNKKVAIIIGAGPAGLTAAYELLEHTDIKPIIFEMSNDIGGISKTVNYKGNRIDIGGHRFFSKSDKVMNWWAKFLPTQGQLANGDTSFKITYQNQKHEIQYLPGGPDPEKSDKVMLVRQRLSRIYYLRKFFDYPIRLSLKTIVNLGLFKVLKIGGSYLKVRMFPIKQELSLEDFIINRFGRELYLTFFKDYTEKVWGLPCHAISPEWGAQRIKGLSITKAIRHALKNSFDKDDTVNQRGTETSLIEIFLYPKFGPGQLWEEVANCVRDKGGEILFNKRVKDIDYSGPKIECIHVLDTTTGITSPIVGNYFFSTMPVKNLIAGLGKDVPSNVKRIAEGLKYRDFITIGLLVSNLKNRGKNNADIADNWIYIQEKDVKIGRLQIFNNWSPYMVKDQNTTWLGLEYFCNEGDSLWNLSDEQLGKLGISELAKIQIIDDADVLDHVVIRVPKAYPAYVGTYNEFDQVKEYVNQFNNLFLIGRNGMHRYNNQDHSMLTAMTAVQNIVTGKSDKQNIWNINAEEEYLETKQ